MKPILKTALLEPSTTTPRSALQENTFFNAVLYTDPDLLPIEIKHIFHKTWLYVGDGTALSQPGSTWVTEVAGYSLLIARSQDGQLRAFHNVCPHRAAMFCTEPGIYHQKQWVCPYHAWVYDLEGNLIGTPSQDRFPDGFQLQDFPLKAVRVGEWNGFIFVCFNADAPPLLAFLHPIPDEIQGYRSDSTQLMVKRQYPVACNWKNYHDNTLCDYHVAIAHRDTLNPIQGPIRFYEHTFYPYVNLLYTPTPAQWRASNPALSHLSERNRCGFYTFGIFPNLHFLAFPNGVMAWLRIDPVTVEACQVNLEVYGIPGFSATQEILEQEFEAFMREDMAITEGVQRGYASGAYSAGIANGLEDRIIHQQKLIRRFLLEG